MIWNEADEVLGNTDSNSGRVAYWLSPFVQVLARRWTLEATFQAPVFQNVSGSALSIDYRFGVHGSINF